ncbi:hypothetical protein F511_11556 [Dorcoceras hygrometricum]|uniref:Uncharacterized protein n=1 Tax=Dorcoceras hygrometricum TaxID=472368 RepID=A0A2Z7D1L5_9LAMI|nr:hypothetical protein F511_11556 [Dorcoceras hygrometricum]
MQYLNRAIHEQGYQESSVGKAQRLSCADLINHQHLVIFRCDDSVDHHKALWYSGTTTQPATTSKTGLDLSGGTTQPADHNVQRNSALKGSGSIYSRTALVRNQTVSQLRDLVHNLHLKQLQSQELLTYFKPDFDQKMNYLELGVEDIRESHLKLFNEQWKQQLDLLR